MERNEDDGMIDNIYKYFTNFVNSKDDIRYDGNFGNTPSYVLVSKYGFRLKFGFELIGGYTTLEILDCKHIPYNIQSTKNFQRLQNRFLRKKYGLLKSLFSSKLFEGYLEFFSMYLDERIVEIVE